MSKLRRRMTSAKDLLGPSQSHSAAVLSRETVLKYKEKLQPIFPLEFFENLENNDADASDTDRRRTHFVLEHSLSVPIATVYNLHVQPGDPHFAIWLFISAYFPVIAACIAPLGNLISLVGLLEHWQIDPVTLRTVPDHEPEYALNILAFILGILGNVSLLMNFSGQVRYLLAQCVSIFSFVAACACLLVAVLLADHRIRHSRLEPSEGFWLAVFTIGMYALCTCVLATNVTGYLMNKYRARFNLDKKQRSLMSHTISFSIWQAVGTVVMAQLIPGIAYGSSLYYCTVSMLTIGLGDIVPMSPGAKVFALVFSLVGVLIMGLIISVLRQVILTSAGPSLFWHHIEKKRLALLQKLEDELAETSKPEAFAMMRTLRSKVTHNQGRVALALTLLVFISFWLVGALIFHSIEKWGFFNAMYFCFLCLVTIGYGDFHPDTSLGRIFFVVWAIAAVPLMTILISNLGDTLFDISDKLDSVTLKLFESETYKRLLWWKSYSPEVSKNHNHSSAVGEAVEDSDTYSRENAPSGDTETSTKGDQETGDDQEIDSRYVEQMDLTAEISDSLRLLKQILADAMDVPGKEYDYEEWAKHMKHLGVSDTGTSGFWVGDQSPLRLPLKESNYLLMKSLMKIDKDMRKLMDAQEKTFLPEEDDTIEGHTSSSRDLFYTEKPGAY